MLNRVQPHPQKLWSLQYAASLPTTGQVKYLGELCLEILEGASSIPQARQLLHGKRQATGPGVSLLRKARSSGRYTRTYYSHLRTSGLHLSSRPRLSVPTRVHLRSIVRSGRVTSTKSRKQFFGLNSFIFLATCPRSIQPRESLSPVRPVAHSVTPAGLDGP